MATTIKSTAFIGFRLRDPLILWGGYGIPYIKGLYWEPQIGNPKNIAGI